MKCLSRRTFLAASAAAVVSPAIGTAAPASEVDAVIIGAGAAGIAAARRFSTVGRKFVLLEAADHIGGGCVTDTKLFGVPFDRGAHWMYAPEFNPLVKFAPKAGLDFDQASTRLHMRVGRRDARDSE